MAYLRVILNAIELLFNYLALLYQYHSFFTSHFFFSAWCLCCFMFNPPHVWCYQQIRKNNFFPGHIVLSWTVLSKWNGNKFKDKTIQGTLRFGAVKQVWNFTKINLFMVVFKPFYQHSSCKFCIFPE